MRVLITGGKGQLGSDLTEILQLSNHDVIPLSSRELDVTNNESVFKQILHLRPDVIVHAGAYTQVDKAEEDIERAYQINAIGSRNIALAATKIDAKLIYISTDYVFDGKANKPYSEFDKTNPMSIYGKSKLAGEELVKQFSKDYFILRTSWVYGKHGNNFVKTMLKLAKERNEISVVNDQIGSPTYTVDLAAFISEIMQTELFGTYHVSNSGSCSWYEFAKEIYKESGIDIKVNPITTMEFPRPAPRPSYSVMDHMGIRLNNLNGLRAWRDALIDFIRFNGRD